MTYEKIEVFIDCERGRTVCVCPKGNKRCPKNCEEATLLRDRYEGWQGTMNTSRFGPESRKHRR